MLAKFTREQVIEMFKEAYCCKRQKTYCTGLLYGMLYYESAEVTGLGKDKVEPSLNRIGVYHSHISASLHRIADFGIAPPRPFSSFEPSLFDKVNLIYLQKNAIFPIIDAVNAPNHLELAVWYGTNNVLELAKIDASGTLCDLIVYEAPVLQGYTLAKDIIGYKKTPIESSVKILKRKNQLALCL